MGRDNFILKAISGPLLCGGVREASAGFVAKI
jgi:hypothetical protein